MSDQRVPVTMDEEAAAAIPADAFDRARQGDPDTAAADGRTALMMMAVSLAG